MTTRLERIYIRAKVGGKWGTYSLAEVDDEQFANWYGNYMLSRAKVDRLAAIEHLDHIGIPPIELAGDFDND